MTNKEAIERLKEGAPFSDLYVKEWEEAVSLAIKALEKRPKGEWYYNYQNGWHCSICHGTVKDMPTVMGKADFNFCPNCGAKNMRKEEEK
jgi:hypothetical protein